MRIKNSYMIFFLIVCTILLQSRSGGPATVAGLEVSGAPGSSGDQGTCGNTNCHTSGTFDPTMDVSMGFTGFDDPLTEYIPGEKYIVRFKFEADNGTIVGTGFQGVALDANDSNIGLWENDLSSLQIVNINDRSYIEHTQAVNTDLWGAFWTAPEAGSGDVTFYGAGIATNADGTSAGDGVGSGSFTITEGEPSSISQIDQDFADITIAPNPIVDQAKLSISSQIGGDFQLNVINIAGQKVHSENIFIQAGQNEKNLNFSDLQSGMYFLQLMNADAMSTQQLIKL